MNFSILWAKLFLSVSLLAVLAVISRGRKFPGAAPLFVLFSLLIARDIAYSFYPHPLIIPLSDIVALAAILAWSRVATERWPADRIYLGVNAAACAAGIFLAVVPLVPLSAFEVGLLLLADMVYVAIALGLVSTYTARNVPLVSRTRFLLISVLLLSHIITLLYGYNYDWVHWVVLPPVYVAFFSILLTT